jgi:hypothetical protein
LPLTLPPEEARAFLPFKLKVPTLFFFCVNADFLALSDYNGLLILYSSEKIPMPFWAQNLPTMFLCFVVKLAPNIFIDRKSFGFL